MTASVPMVQLADVRAAAERIAEHVHRTPVVRCRAIDDLVGVTVLLKHEGLQRGGAFKFRGACNAIASLSPQERRRGVFAYSSGNHAQAVALAARLHDLPATILMPQDAPAGKLAATRGYGAEVLTYDRWTQDRTQLAEQLAAERGLPIVRPFDDPAIVAGQGTVALELLDQVGDVDALLTPLGGGGLLAGCSTVVRARCPGATIVGVEPEAGDDWRRSLDAGRPVQIEVPRTIADGLQTVRPGDVTFPIVRANVDEVVTVTDEELVTTMRLLFERAKVVVEPSGAAGLAALLSGRVAVPGPRVAVVLSGANVDADRFAQLVA